LALKKLQMLSPEDIKHSFRKEGLIVFSETAQFQLHLREKKWENSNLLLMSSGNFDGLQLKEFAGSL